MPNFDPETIQKEELDALNNIYHEELTVHKFTAPCKFEVECFPLLENKNFEMHYEYDNPHLTIQIQFPEDYPKQKPKFHYESTCQRVIVGGNLANLFQEANKYLDSLVGEPCIMELIEFTRNWLYKSIAKMNKHFKKRRHIFNKNYDYGDGDDIVDEEIGNKPISNPVTKESFEKWRVLFNAEMKAKKLLDPNYLRKLAFEKKPSGRQIFDEKAIDFKIYFDDQNSSEGEKGIELHGHDVNNEEDIEIDEGLFDDEDEDEDSDFEEVFD